MAQSLLGELLSFIWPASFYSWENIKLESSYREKCKADLIDCLCSSVFCLAWFIEAIEGAGNTVKMLL